MINVKWENPVSGKNMQFFYCIPFVLNDDMWTCVFKSMWLIFISNIYFAILFKVTLFITWTNIIHKQRGGVVQWVYGWLVMWRSLIRAPLKTAVVSLSKKLYPYCLVLVGSRNGFELDITIELNHNVGLMEDWLKCQISPLVKYRQNQKPKQARSSIEPLMIHLISNHYN